MKRCLWLLPTFLIAGMVFSFLPSATDAQTTDDNLSVWNQNHMACSQCHSLHGGTGTLLSQARNELCQTCHDPTTGTDPNAPKRLTHFNTSGSSDYQHRLECLDCHNPHRFQVNKRGIDGTLSQDPPGEDTCSNNIISSGGSDLGDGGTQAPTCGQCDQETTPTVGISGAAAVTQDVTICRNFAMLGNLNDKVAGVRNKFMIRTVLRRVDDFGCRRNCPTPILTESNLGSFDMDLATNVNTTDDGWDTLNAPADGTTWLQANFGSGAINPAGNSLLGEREILEVRLYMQAASYTGAYAIEYSDTDPPQPGDWTQVTGIQYSSDGATWADVTDDLFRPTAQGFNAVRWAHNATLPEVHQYWRLRLAETDTSTVLISEVEFYGPTDCTLTAGTPVFDSDNFYTGCKRFQVAGRRVAAKNNNTLVQNDWVSTPGTGGVLGEPPYQGICNVCHTRTQHHRNNNIQDPNDFYYTSHDHTHNDDRTCSDCHDHKSNGFSKGQ